MEIKGFVPSSKDYSDKEFRANCLYLCYGFYKLPVKITNSLDKINRDFWWNGSTESNVLHTLRPELGQVVHIKMLGRYFNNNYAWQWGRKETGATKGKTSFFWRGIINAMKEIKGVWFGKLGMEEPNNSYGKLILEGYPLKRNEKTNFTSFTPNDFKVVLGVDFLTRERLKSLVNVIYEVCGSPLSICFGPSAVKVDAKTLGQDVILSIRKIVPTFRKKRMGRVYLADVTDVKHILKDLNSKENTTTIL
ncbi:hypothetical protein IFM89_004473 [Coptis chinensis]|uniref:Uncharacterized protein n=1 Tax=Coptis chinensis TaxID=261450 RepID=A0A835GU59_9MAGN|nr:hypothetical protein IFM89_004473 [Coptis chinensis]